VASSEDPTLLGDPDGGDDSRPLSAAPTPEDGVGLETRRLRAAIGSKLFGNSETAAPTKIGRHMLLEPLGAGGMGVVYTAYDPQLDRRVAIKVLHSASNAPGSRASERLLREAQAMAKLNHPHVIAVHDAGVVDGRVFLAMEYIDGGTLTSWCEAHRAGTRQRFFDALDLLLQAARGLVAAHAAGLVHRDLKPANMLIDSANRLRVADFGLARSDVTASSDDSSEPSTAAPLSQGLTGVGELVGTPVYMAPEQFEGRSDARSDQWAWCATAWEAVYGTRAFPGSSVAELIACRLAGAPAAPAARQEVPGWFHRVLARGLAADPAQRYGSMAALIRDVERRRRSRQRIATGAGLAGLVAFAAWGWASRGAPPPPVSRCDGLADRFAATYDADIGARILEGVEARGRVGMAGLADRVVARLDDFGKEWVAGAQRSCRALEAAGEWVDDTEPLDQPAGAMPCYRDALTQVSVVVEEELRAPMASEAISITDALPALGRCANFVGEGAVQMADGRQISRLVAAGMIHTALRDHAAAQRDLDAASELLGEGSSPTLAARIEYTRGMLAHRVGDTARALTLGRSALGQAELGGDTGLITEIWVLLADVARDADQLDDASFYVDRALSVSRQAGDPPWMLAMGLRAKAAVLLSQGESDRAREVAESALAQLAAAYGEESVKYGRMQETYVEILRGVGANEEAIAAADRALAIFRAHYGPDHPDTALVAARLAGVFEDFGDLPRAIELYAEAEAVLRTHPNVDPINKVIVVFSRAQALTNARRFDEARRASALAYADAQRLLGAESPVTNTVRTAQAAVELDAGDYLAAIAMYEELLATSLGRNAWSEDINRHVLCVNLGVAYARAGRLDDAVRQADRCDDYAEGLTPPNPLFFPTAYRFLGELYQRAGQLDRARDYYVRAVDVFDRDSTGRVERTESHLGIAEIDVAQHQLEGVATHLQAVRASLAQTPDPKLQQRLDALLPIVDG
jgi:serine/threonine-protein kinase